MATLVNQVRAITKSSTNETTSDQVVDFIRSGTKYVLSSLPLVLAYPFAETSSGITTGASISLDTNKVISVRRNGIPCKQVSADLAYDVVDSNSLHYAPNRYPVFFLYGNELSIKPDPASTAVGYVKFVDIVSIANSISSTDTSSIGQYDSIVVKYGAALDYMGLSGYWGDLVLTNINSTAVTTGARDALLNAQNLIDSKTNYDAEDFLAEEDPEMSGAVVAVANQEVNRALAELRGSEQSSAHTVQMIQKAQELFAEAERELTTAINQGRINDASRSNGASGQ